MWSTGGGEPFAPSLIEGVSSVARSFDLVVKAFAKAGQELAVGTDVSVYREHILEGEKVEGIDNLEMKAGVTLPVGSITGLEQNLGETTTDETDVDDAIEDVVTREKFADSRDFGVRGIRG